MDCGVEECIGFYLTSILYIPCGMMLELDLITMMNSLPPKRFSLIIPNVQAVLEGFDALLLYPHFEDGDV